MKGVGFFFLPQVPILFWVLHTLTFGQKIPYASVAQVGKCHGPVLNRAEKIIMKQVNGRFASSRMNSRMRLC